jgi:hypothetical protein
MGGSGVAVGVAEGAAVAVPVGVGLVVRVGVAVVVGIGVAVSVGVDVGGGAVGIASGLAFLPMNGRYEVYELAEAPTIVDSSKPTAANAVLQCLAFMCYLRSLVIHRRGCKANSLSMLERKPTQGLDVAQPSTPRVLLGLSRGLSLTDRFCSNRSYQLYSERPHGASRAGSESKRFWQAP